MPIVSISIPETDQSVSRPIIIDIVRQLASLTKIPDNTKVLFAGDSQVQQMHGTSIDEKGRWAEYGNDRYIQIEAVETYNEDRLLTNATTQSQHLPIFLDNRIGVVLRPSYITSDVVITFKYKSPSKTDGIRWRNDILGRVAQGKEMNEHKLHYHYPIPREYLVLLKEIHTLRESVAGYGETLVTYLMQHFSSRVSEIGNLIKSNTELAVSETQTRVIGLFDLKGAPDKQEKEDDSGTWVTTFSYKFSYERPNMCVCEYPIMVHNQMLPSIYVLDPTDVTTTTNDDLSYSISGNAFSMFEAQRQLSDARVGLANVISIPKEDHFIPNGISYGTTSIFYALSQVEVDLKTLINLNELGDIALDKDILQFLKDGEYAHLATPNGSIYRVELYRGYDAMHVNSLTCDANLLVSSVAPLDLRDMHRVRFSIVSDLSLLSPDAVTRLCMNPRAFIKTLITIDPTIATIPSINAMLMLPVVSKTNWNSFFNYITGSSYNGVLSFTPAQLALAQSNYGAYVTSAGLGLTVPTPGQLPINVAVPGTLNSNGAWVSNNTPIKPNTYDPNNVLNGINMPLPGSLDVVSLKTVMLTSIITYKPQ